MEAVAALEEWVDLSVKDGPYKAEASRQLDLLRADPSRWAVGIRTFQDSKIDVVRYFGLSLIRDFLLQDATSFVADVTTRKSIRESCWMWIETISAGSTTVPSYMMNAMTSILTLCIKRDYPEHWPSAFDNLLDLGARYEILGTEIVIKVLQELEVEVVMFNESRSREEVAHNTLIKDHMRASDTIINIVGFLCQAAHRAQSGNPHMYTLAVKSLECLAELIGWIDIAVVTQRALPTIYAALDAPPGLAAAALHCVLEICKKGMDPVAKFQLLYSLQVVPMLLSKDYPKRFCHDSLPFVEDSESDEVRCVRHFALCLDMIIVEGLGIWMRFEELAVVPAAVGPSPSVEKGKGSRRKRGEAVGGLNDLNPILGPLAQILTQVTPQALQLVQQRNISIFRAILPSISKYIQLLRSQKAALQLTCGKCVLGPNGESFQASTFIDDLLVALQLQSQLPDDFDFEGLDDEDQEALDIMEAKNEARKLFINCARSHGSRCLELLQHILSCFPRPLSQVSFPPLEATLRLLQAFPESEDRDAVVPRMVLFLYTQVDLLENSHPQVHIALHELCLRWLARQATTGAAEAQVLTRGAEVLCSHIEGHSSLTHTKYHQSLRSKLVHLLLKYTEAFDENRFLLFQHIGQRVIGKYVGSFSTVKLLYPHDRTLPRNS